MPTFLAPRPFGSGGSVNPTKNQPPPFGPKVPPTAPQPVGADMPSDPMKGLADAIAAAGGVLGGGGTAPASASPNAPPVTTWTPAVGAPAGSPTIAAPKPVGAEDAIYSRAKDRVGASVQGLTKALRNQFAGRGLSGSSIEGQALGGAMSAANGQLADVSRDIAIESADDQNDFLKLGYEGSISQRGQDLGAISAANANTLTARGQDIGRAESDADRAERDRRSRTDTILGLLDAFRKGSVKY